METIAKGLHGVNKKIPQMVLRRDVLSFSLQLLSLFVCVVSSILWVLFGFDSSVEQIVSVISNKPPTPAGAGFHISTILNFFLIAFLVSNYLSRKDVIGFHNVLVSIFTPIVAMMVFEFPWFILADLFHNSVVEGYWAITLFGLGSIDIGMLIFAMVLIPMSVFYFAFLWAKGHIAVEKVIPFAIACAVMTATAVFCFSITFGTLTVLIRNTFSLFFLVFAHSTLMDAVANPMIKELATKYNIKQRIKGPLILTAASIAVFATWIWWPYFTQVKGNMWPQTLYAFYTKSGQVDRFVWLQNDAVHALNVLSKALVTAAVTLAIIPKIKVTGK